MLGKHLRLGGDLWESFYLFVVTADAHLRDVFGRIIVLIFVDNEIIGTYIVLVKNH